MSHDESAKPCESNLNHMTDMTNSEVTKQPMLPDSRRCVADQNDELSKHSVTNYVRKLMRNPYRSPAIEQGLSPFANMNMLPGTENLPEFLTRKFRACFLKTRLLESVWCII